MRKVNWIAYKQGSGWVINDGYEVSQLHYSVKTKKDVIVWATLKSEERGFEIEITFG